MRPLGSRARTALVYLCGSLGGVLFGYDSGIIAGALLFIRKDMGLSPQMQGMVVGALLLGAMVGALAAGRLARRWGPRRMMLGAGVLFIVSALASAAAPDPVWLMAMRWLVGLAVGVAQIQVPLYLSEISPKSRRGALTSLTQLSTAIGIFVSYLTAWLLAAHGHWRWMLALAAVPSLLLTIGMAFQPESPRWLMQRGRREEARRVLQTTSAEHDEQAVLDQIASVNAGSGSSWTGMLRSRSGRAVLCSVFGLAIFQQLMGINTVVYYAPTILRAAGFGESSALLNSVGLGALSIVMTVVAGRCVDRFGRRPLLMSGALVMCVSLLVFGYLFQRGMAPTPAGSAIAIIALAAFKAAFSFSWGPVVWVMLPELLPLRMRAQGLSAAVFCLFLANLIVSTAFPMLLSLGALASFGFFAVCCALALLFVATHVRETAGLSLEEIEQGATSIAA